MCGRFTLRQVPLKVLDDIDHSELQDLVPRFNIAPSQEIATIVQRRSSREAAFMRWGLIPSWSKGTKGFINARVETINERPSFKASFEKRRCLILADGFYEWERNGRFSQPYYFQMRDAAPFAFAGIYDRWHDEACTITSCAIITTTANTLLAEIHNRMPVILETQAYDLWLSESSRAADLKDLLVPFPAEEMMSHAVSYDVNDTKIDNALLLRRVEPMMGVTLSLF